jgi:hypothetical protein
MTDVKSSNERASAEVERLRAELLKYRKIAAHVPAREWIKAKELAGYATYVFTLDATPAGTPQPAAKQRLLALVADLDKATNIMVVKTWSVRGIANTLRHIANGLPVETLDAASNHPGRCGQQSPAETHRMTETNRTSKQIAFESIVRDLRAAGECETSSQGRLYWLAADQLESFAEALGKIAQFPDPGLDGVNANYMRSYARETLAIERAVGKSDG